MKVVVVFNVCLSVKPSDIYKIVCFIFYFFVFFYSTCLCTSLGIYYQFGRRLVSGQAPLNPQQFFSLLFSLSFFLLLFLSNVSLILPLTRAAVSE